MIFDPEEIASGIALEVALMLTNQERVPDSYIERVAYDRYLSALCRIGTIKERAEAVKQGLQKGVHGDIAMIVHKRLLHAGIERWNDSWRLPVRWPS